VDGNKVATDIGRPEGFLIVPVPAGDHVVEVSFTNTLERKVSLIISAMALIGSITIALQFAKHRGEELVTHLDEPNEGVKDWASIWPVFGVSILFLVFNAVIIEPTAIFRYESADFSARPAENKTFANFGDQIALIGYDLESKVYNPGDQVDLTLYWKAMNPQDINYQVFVHLIDANGNLVTQSDKLNPGDYPTRRWPLDKYVRDAHKLALPTGMAAGDYLISVGLWVASDGWRLPVSDETGEQIGDNYRLPEILAVRRE
jgi:hypothetical protein